VAVDAVPLHQDADRGADIGAGVEGNAQLFDLFRAAKNRAGVAGEDFGNLQRGMVEASSGTGIEIEPACCLPSSISWMAA
jgi:hypothetical protein